MNSTKRLVALDASYRARQLLPQEVTLSIAQDMSLLTSELSERKIDLTLDQCRAIAKDFCVVGAFIEDKGILRLVGMACIVVMRLPQGLRLLLESVVVKSSWRNAGIGTAILDQVFELSRELGAEHISLTCRATRSSAARLYAAQGFAVADTSVWRKSLRRIDIKRHSPSRVASAHRHP